jgi:hypothetical protein
MDDEDFPKNLDSPNNGSDNGFSKSTTSRNKEHTFHNKSMSQSAIFHPVSTSARQRANTNLKESIEGSIEEIEVERVSDGTQQDFFNNLNRYDASNSIICKCHKYQYLRNNLILSL